MFFPSILNCIALALLPLNQSQFVFIQFLHALILSWPQAVFDYFPYIEKRVNIISSIVQGPDHNEHADIIKRGIDNRTDLYKLCYVLAQIVALAYLAVCVVRRNRVLQARFKARVKLRLIQINLQSDHSNGEHTVLLSLTASELEALGLTNVVQSLPEL